MKNRILVLMAMVTIFAANPLFAMDDREEGMTVYTLPRLTIKVQDFGSGDFPLVSDYKRLLKEYFSNPNNTSTSILSPSLKCLPRLLWELEKELHKDDPATSSSLRDANSSVRLDSETIESFCYSSEILRDDRGNKACIGSSVITPANILWIDRAQKSQQ